MAAVTKQLQPPPGYPTGGEAKEEQAPQVVDDKAQQNGEDDGETDRGISAGSIIGRPKPLLHERGYSGPVLYNYSGQETHGQPPYQPHGRNVYQIHDLVDDYEVRYYPQYYRQRPRRGPIYSRDQYGRY
jgi:hypothetical protein